MLFQLQPFRDSALEPLALEQVQVSDLLAIEHLVDQGAKELVLLLHYEANLIRSMIAEIVGRNNMNDVMITSIVEARPLGTGGSIMNAINTLKFNESFLVINADTWLGDGLNQLSLSTPNSIAAVEVKDCSRYGALALKDNKIERFLEKELSHKSGLINAGLYHLSPDIFTEFVEKSCFSIECDVFPAVADGGNLSAIPIDADFIDIGIPQDYFRFCRWMESGKEIEL